MGVDSSGMRRPPEPATAERRSFVADRGDAAQRLDAVLERRLGDRPDGSRTRIQRWIAAGRVAVNGVTARRPAQRVPAGGRVEALLPQLPPRREPEPEDLPLAILYEDADLIAVDKPAGMVAHPALGHARGTLFHALLWRARDWAPGGRPLLAHRLDRHTSGVLLVAKTAAAHAALLRALAHRTVTKEYLAVVAGRVPGRRGDLAWRLQRDPGDRRRMVPSVSGGQPCLTRYRRLGVSPTPGARISLLSCELVTGRMHQIRAHLATAGWPIVGDQTYGPAVRPVTGDHRLDAAVASLSRQALHAWRITFPHPATGERVRMTAPLPVDLAGLLHAARIAWRDA
jgi:23S rRNA pseudouridine1911/1915/1917 synthase